MTYQLGIIIRLWVCKQNKTRKAYKIENVFMKKQICLSIFIVNTMEHIKFSMGVYQILQNTNINGMKCCCCSNYACHEPVVEWLSFVNLEYRCFSFTFIQKRPEVCKYLWNFLTSFHCHVLIILMMLFDGVIVLCMNKSFIYSICQDRCTVLYCYVFIR